jgi:hypothetical protein
MKKYIALLLILELPPTVSWMACAMLPALMNHLFQVAFHTAYLYGLFTDSAPEHARDQVRVTVIRTEIARHQTAVSSCVGVPLYVSVLGTYLVCHTQVLLTMTGILNAGDGEEGSAVVQ